MVVISRFGVRPTAFDLGRILRVEEAMTIDLETYVPSGDHSGLFVSISADSPADRTAFVERVRKHPSVSGLETVDVFENRTLIGMEWDVRSDYLFQTVQACDGRILRVSGTAEEWEFVIRFPSHDGMTQFREYCDAHGIAFTTLQIYQLRESRTRAGQRLFGLTDAQREALTIAVENGYYDIPRQCSTSDLAAELGVSDQAVSERLRRGVANFVYHTFLDGTVVNGGPADEDSAEDSTE
jgi:predicted DNA binding protein